MRNEYKYVGQRMYESKKGRKCMSNVYETKCVVCGITFEFAAAWGNKRPGRIHCSAHKLGMGEVHQRINARRPPNPNAPLLRITGKTDAGEEFCAGLVHGERAAPILPKGIEHWSIDGIKRYGARRGWQVEAAT